MSEEAGGLKVESTLSEKQGQRWALALSLECLSGAAIT